MQLEIAEFALRKHSDVRLAGQRARLLATLHEIEEPARAAFGRAVSQLAQAAISARGSSLHFGLNDSAGGLAVLAAAIRGPREGVDSLRQAVSQTDDGIEVSEPTVAGDGVEVRVCVPTASPLGHVTDTDVAEWAGILRTRRSEAILASSQRRSRELAEQLASIQKQRQELEAELQETRSLNETLTLLSLVASKTDNAVIIMDESGDITWVNDAFIRMTGYALNDAGGLRPDLLLSGDDTSDQALREIDEAFSTGRGVSEEFLQYRRDGSRSWISLSLTPIHDNTAEVSRWIGIGADITRRREAQLALEKARNEAEAASQARGNFLAGMSHEIRTPMNSILGMTELALATDLTEEQREYLTTAKQSAEALLELINDILDLSKIESGKMQLHAAPFHLRTLVEDTCKPFAFIASRRGLELRWSVADSVPEWLEGDSLRLRQILVNLVGNAVKFTQTGEVSVGVNAVAAGDDVSLTIEVADTGIGISREKLESIFESFTQADTQITRQYGGTGLGLAISQQLLQLMGGEIDVDSEEGAGSTFTVSLVLSPALPETSGPVGPTGRSGLHDEHPEPSPLRVLVADDHPANRALAQNILRKRGHSCSVVDDGRQAIEALERERFDVILMDLQMPVMDGFEAAAAIRSREQSTQTHIPIIALTAHSRPEDREASLTAGMDAFLSKPVRVNELVTLVERLGGNQVNVTPPARSRISDGSENVTAEELPEPAGDFAAALERMDHDAELLQEQMEFFLRDGPALAETISTALQSGSTREVQIAAHRLKNLFATLDDDETAAACGALEATAADGQHAAALTEQIHRGLSELLRRINGYLSLS